MGVQNLLYGGQDLAPDAVELTCEVEHGNSGGHTLDDKAQAARSTGGEAQGVSWTFAVQRETENFRLDIEKSSGEPYGWATGANKAFTASSHEMTYLGSIRVGSNEALTSKERDRRSAYNGIQAGTEHPGHFPQHGSQR